MLITKDAIKTINFLEDYLKSQQKSNKYLKGFWRKTLYSRSKFVKNISYFKTIEDRRNADNPDDATEFYLCFYCKKITNYGQPNQIVEYIDIQYENFVGQNYIEALEKMIFIYENYEPDSIKI
jgi:hypothetical protein